MRLLNLWTEKFGGVFIPVDKIVFLNEDEQGFGVIQLVDGTALVTSTDLKDIVRELTHQGVFQCQQTQLQ